VLTELGDAQIPIIAAVLRKTSQNDPHEMEGRFYTSLAPLETKKKVRKWAPQKRSHTCAAALRSSPFPLHISVDG